MAWSLSWRLPLIQLLLQTVGYTLPAWIRDGICVTEVERWICKRFVRKHGIVAALLAAVEGSWWWSPSARDWFQAHRRIAWILTNFPPTFDEKRYPFLDQTITEFLASIPSDQLLRPGERRSLMRRALVHIVPSEILSRRTKQLEA